MAYSTTSQERTLADINITPLVDVMLVLLVIFMIAAPTLTHRIELTLPQPGPDPVPSSEPIRLRIDAAGQAYWNEAAQPLSALQSLMAVEMQRHPDQPPPLLQIEASADADYGVVAKVLAAARNAQMDRIAFIHNE
jgi:biopolymer transport protein ExbD